MKYICSKGHVFIYADILRFQQRITDTDKAFIDLAERLSMINIYPLLEMHICPLCNDANKNFTEYVEPLPDIESVKSVDLAQVDDYLKQGYTVKELYAKNATLVKCKVVEQEKSKDVA